MFRPVSPFGAHGTKLPIRARGLIAALTFLTFGDAQVTFAEAPEGSVVTELSIEVRAPDLADPAQLRDALKDDLGPNVRVTLVGPGDAHASSHLVVELGGDATVIVLHLHHGSDDRSREIDVAGGLADRSAALALIASNLVRDEADELIAALRAQRLDETAPDEEVEVEQDEQDDEDEQVAEEDEPEPEIAPPRDPDALVHSYVGLDLAPYVGTSSYFRGRDIRGLSLGLAGAWSGEIRGLSVSGAVDVTGRFRGLQIAGGLALSTGDAAGIQAAGGASVTLEDFDGVQFAGGSSTTLGRFRGLQLSSGANVAWGVTRGGQFAIANYALELRGLQFGVLNLGGSVTGVQVGVANYADEVHGIQMGMLNVTSGKVRGVQIGLINLADDADASIGLVNIHRNGRTQFRLGMDTSGFIEASLVHGGRITHSIYSLSANPVGSRASVVFGLGVGARVPLGERFHLDIDIIARALLAQSDEPEAAVSSSAILEPRLVLGMQVYKAVGVFVGLGYPVRFTGAEEPDSYSSLTRVLRDTGPSAYVDAWPSLSLGLEFF